MSQQNNEEKIYVQERAADEHIYKVIVIGDPAIGKTSLIRKFVKVQFETDYIPTVGVSISKQPVEIQIGGQRKKVNLMLWDMAGQPQFYMLHKVYYNGANGVIIGFDLTRSDTYMNVKNWYNELAKTPKLLNVPMILVGNKADLESERKVSEAHVSHMQEQLGIDTYLETSALNGQNVDKLFEEIARQIYEQQNQ